MNNNVITVIIAFALFVLGLTIGITMEEKITYERCVTANPAVPVGEIRSFCEERLYYKSYK